MFQVYHVPIWRWSGEWVFGLWLVAWRCLRGLGVDGLALDPVRALTGQQAVTPDLNVFV